MDDKIAHRLPTEPNGHVAQAAIPRQAGIQLLGGLRIDQRFVGSPRSVAGRIVAFLALRKESSRSTIAGTLWPDVTEARALGSLRSGIWKVQQRFPGLVTADATRVALSRDVRVDATDIMTLARMIIDDSPDLHDTQLRYFLRHDAELLPGWEDDWLPIERERLLQLRVHALESLAMHMCRKKNFGLALEAALNAVQCDPLRESAHRAVIQVHLAQGNLADARRWHADCLRMFQQELGLDPGLSVPEQGWPSG